MRQCRTGQPICFTHLSKLHIKFCFEPLCYAIIRWFSYAHFLYDALLCYIFIWLFTTWIFNTMLCTAIFHSLYAIQLNGKILSQSGASSFVVYRSVVYLLYF